MSTLFSFSHFTSTLPSPTSHFFPLLFSPLSFSSPHHLFLPIRHFISTLPSLRRRFPSTLSSLPQSLHSIPSYPPVTSHQPFPPFTSQFAPSLPINPSFPSQQLPFSSSFPSPVTSRHHLPSSSHFLSTLPSLPNGFPSTLPSLHQSLPSPLVSHLSTVTSPTHFLP